MNALMNIRFNLGQTIIDFHINILFNSLTIPYNDSLCLVNEMDNRST